MGFAPADDNDKHLRLPFMYHDFQVRWYSDNVQVLGIVHRLAVSYRRSIFNHEITMQASVRYWTIVNMERPALLACGPALCSASTRSVAHDTANSSRPFHCDYGVSERRACRPAPCWRSSLRYEGRRDTLTALRQRMRELAPGRSHLNSSRP